MTDLGISADERFGSLYENLLINHFGKNPPKKTYVNPFFKNGVGTDTAKLKSCAWLQ
jgi:hypothetical protein